MAYRHLNRSAVTLQPRRRGLSPLGRNCRARWARRDEPRAAGRRTASDSLPGTLHAMLRAISAHPHVTPPAARERQLLQRLARSEIGHRLLHSLTLAEMTAFCARLRDQGLDPGDVRFLYATMRRLVAVAGMDAAAHLTANQEEGEV